MRLLSPNALSLAPARRKFEQARAGVVLLVAVVFALGVAVGVFSAYRMNRGGSTGSAVGGTSPGALSEATRSILQQLDSPLEIRFYSSLDPASVSEAVRAFSGRVDQLLSEFERESSGKIKVSRYTSLSDSNAKMAASDGINFFNRDKGDACFFGIAVVRDESKEVLPNLSLEREQALESDLSQAIARVAVQKPAAKNLVNTPRVDASSVEQVRRVIPDVSAVSLDDGTRILREAALKEFTAAAKEAQSRMSEAQQRLAAAQNGGSESEQQVAMKQLQQAQSEQTEKIKQIAARLQAQIAAFEQLKGAGRPETLK